ncbi:uncharacterized protein UHOD_11567 [Ustilago sp. UG-2017b]|nr:uncharacterized protein UHOD_11567 [Ustilago sp. UG-2017b]
MLSVVPFAHNVLDRKATTFEDADSMLSSIIIHSFSNKLCTEYFAEHGNRPVPIAIDLFDWVVKKCTVHSAAKEYKLLTSTYALRWDQIGSHVYDFLTKWEVRASELHTYLQDPWLPNNRYKTLKCALPLDRNALSNWCLYCMNNLMEKYKWPRVLLMFYVSAMSSPPRVLPFIYPLSWA